jgi:hypothetical protein
MVDISRGKIVKRTWRWQGKKRVAYLFDVAVDGRRVRKQYASKQEAKEALDAFREDAKQPPVPAAAPGITFAQAIEEYVKAKARKKSLAHDKLYLGELQAALGADTPLTEITAATISRWKNDKLSVACARTGRPYSAAAVNRPLAATAGVGAEDPVGGRARGPHPLAGARRGGAAARRVREVEEPRVGGHRRHRAGDRPTAR